MKVSKCIKYFMKTFIGSCLTLSIASIITPVLMIFYITSLLASQLMKIKYGARVERATGYDVLFGMDSEHSYPIINVAFRFSGKLDSNKFRSRILAMIQNSVDDRGRKRYDRLTKTYSKVFGYAVWMDPEKFDIDQHIELIQLEDLTKECKKDVFASQENGPINSTNIEELQMKNASGHGNIDWEILTKYLLNKFGSKKIRETIPQWQVILLEENSERYTALFRFHHAIADGVYLSRMLWEGFLDIPVNLFHSYIQPSKLKMLLLNLWSFSLIPFGLWKIMKSKDSNLLHGPKLTGKKKFYLSKSMPLDTFRNIRERSKVGTHSVLFSCLSTALASHFKRRSTIVNDVTTLIPMPLQNLRKPIKLRNRFAVVSLKVPTPPKLHHSQQKSSDWFDSRKECCSLDRLQMIKAVFQDAKRDPTFLAVHSLVTAFCSFLPTSLAEYLLTTKGCTVAFSNMPGPETKIYFDADRIEEIMFWNPDRDPLGTGMSVLSYNGKLRVGLLLDEALLTDETEGNLFLQDFENELDDILHELDNQQNAQNDIKCENSEFLKSVP